MSSSPQGISVCALGLSVFLPPPSIAVPRSNECFVYLSANPVFRREHVLFASQPDRHRRSRFRNQRAASGNCRLPLIEQRLQVPCVEHEARFQVESCQRKRKSGPPSRKYFEQKRSHTSSSAVISRGFRLLGRVRCSCGSPIASRTSLKPFNPRAALGRSALPGRFDGCVRPGRGVHQVSADSWGPGKAGSTSVAPEIRHAILA